MRDLTRREIVATVGGAVGVTSGCLGILDSSTGSDWQQWGHDAQNTCYVPNGVEISGVPGNSWEGQISIGMPPGVQDSTVYSGSGVDGLVAVDIADGSRKWTFERPTTIQSTPAIRNGSVYVADINGTVYSVSKSGDEEWQTNISGDVGFSAVSLASDDVFIQTDDGALHCLDASNGEQRWSTPAHGRPAQSNLAPAVLDSAVYVSQDQLRAYDTSDGSQIWESSLAERVRTAPSVDNSHVYAGSKDGTLFAVDRRTGETRWSYSTGGELRSSTPVLADESVYAGNLAGKLFSINASDGTENWSLTTETWITSATSVAGETLYVYSGSSRMAAYESETGELKWATEPEQIPVMSTGCVESLDGVEIGR
ncbi:outer membrane protein assembly factor BamB family protein [Haloarchaeobius iranensis]|uniref:Outer membrane protein assembly factor BamB, contains PQQ-like beta-propeller repeat n=1 Tax=Haloarchaeobius iranensis TaxID=996166 RepID=A0A1H0BWR6_9EURY|nr:PQQ-binding-like beta-propeller repeat protein [Haloarchaeobius iranensis]SDN50023.1 Outer membrane protein assembly factor BamB, contains PQQ-like beta-propeller repeat [Haloarchaeobius iranensis]